MGVVRAFKPQSVTPGAAAARSSPSATRPVFYILAWWLCAALLSGAATTAEGLRIFQPENREPLASEACPNSCSDVFSKLEDGPPGRPTKTQRIQVQERGEPKSGTGFMFEWATIALGHSCMFLQNAYGERSCWIEWTPLNRTMIFDPSLSTPASASCSCDDVEMVVISLTNFDKHTLPVEDSCSFSHRRGISNAHDKVCTPPGSDIQPPGNHAELYKCARESACRIVDDRLQMSVMRDPRPIAVSAYFHTLRTHPELLHTSSVDEYALSFLPAACKWVSIRYLLFAEILGHKSSLFWYDDAQENPGDWHSDFYDFIGIRVPMSVVERSVAVATGQVPDSRLAGFPSKGIDVHSGGSESESSGKRTFRDEVSATTVSKMDDMLRVWLPPVLLEKFGIR
ncbi:unnamed protein product [Scytosiphon promiscuus]